ncbi:uncharacterized protein LOC115216778 [Argonauta hians]
MNMFNIRLGNKSDSEGIARLLQEQVVNEEQKEPLSCDDLKKHFSKGDNYFNVLVAEWNNEPHSESSCNQNCNSNNFSSSNSTSNTPTSSNLISPLLTGYLFFHYHFCVFESKAIRVTDTYVSPSTQLKDCILRDLVGHLTKLAVQENCSHIRWTSKNTEYLGNIAKYFEASSMTKEDSWLFFQIEKSQLIFD